MVNGVINDIKCALTETYRWYTCMVGNKVLTWVGRWQKITLKIPFKTSSCCFEAIIKRVSFQLVAYAKLCLVWSILFEYRWSLEVLRCFSICLYVVKFTNSSFSWLPLLINHSPKSPPVFPTYFVSCLIKRKT